MLVGLVQFANDGSIESSARRSQTRPYEGKIFQQ
jgi:hypothetical protein